MEAGLMEQKQGLFNLPKVAGLSATAFARCSRSTVSTILKDEVLTRNEESAQIANKHVKLSLGMSLTAELITEKRRFIEFFCRCYWGMSK